MTTNETIARWRGWVHTGTPRPWLSPNDERFSSVPKYDEWPASWHGEKGLLAEIEEDTDCWQQFIVALARELGLIRERVSFAVTITMDEVEADEAIWRALKATPAQLATALVEVIGEK